ncbi:MAG: GNAT family N-acetyltransferase [Propionibacteriaceae bacterium]|nr:GNAT family N-acetyltransferase [Propionibacteriaceae bacterium]
MSVITIEPATSERFEDTQHALSGGGDGRGCQCQWWMMTNAEWNRTTQSERQDRLRAEIDAGPPPALIAYVDGEAAGFVRVGPRPTHVRLARTRTLAPNSPEPRDDPLIWTVSCFVVRREYRNQGLNARLLAAAVAYARRSGARAIEAYPIDTGVGRHRSNNLYHGVLSVFQAAGFREVARPKPDLAIVELEL